jgi:TetR/AcrR family transcriptional regulator
MLDKPSTKAKNAAPKKRDALRTREAILQAALVEFCNLGFGGARVDAISLRAKANMRLLYAHFGDKEGLYQAVLEHVYSDIRAAEQRLHLDQLDPVEGMRQLVDFTFTFFQSHQHYISIINNENLLRAQYLRRSEKIRALTLPLVALIENLLVRGYASGAFRPGVDPIQLYVSITALSYFHVSNRHTLSAMFGKDLGAPQWLAERRAHAQDLIVSWIVARPVEGNRRAGSKAPPKRNSSRKADSDG